MIATAIVPPRPSVTPAAAGAAGHPVPPVPVACAALGIIAVQRDGDGVGTRTAALDLATRLGARLVVVHAAPGAPPAQRARTGIAVARRAGAGLLVAGAAPELLDVPLPLPVLLIPLLPGCSARAAQWQRSGGAPAGTGAWAGDAPSRLVMGVDGSDMSEDALPWLADVAAALGAGIDLVRVCAAAPTGDAGPEADAAAAHLRACAARLVEQGLARDAVRAFVRHGVPADELLAQATAEHAAALVLCVHDTPSPETPGVCAEIVRRAPLPVLLLPVHHVS